VETQRINAPGQAHARQELPPRSLERRTLRMLLEGPWKVCRFITHKEGQMKTMSLYLLSVLSQSAILLPESVPK
jgi:hypothetical protein